MSAGQPVAGSDPALEPFIAWSQTLQWASVPAATRQLLKVELLDWLGGAIAGRAPDPLLFADGRPA